MFNSYKRASVKLTTGTKKKNIVNIYMRVLKSKQFLIKLTNQEHELLKQKSKQLNISISDYLRISSINLLKNDYEKTNDTN
jgi:hypothetical protein